MKRIHFLSLSVIALGCLLISATTAQAQTRYRVQPRGKVRIDGSANIHDWAMESGIFSGWFELPTGVMLDPSQAVVAGAADGKVNAKAEISIPINTITSTENREGMNEVMQDAMNAKDHPDIKYKLSEMTLKQPHAAGSPLEFDTKGELTINGVTKSIAMPVKIEATDKMRLKVTSDPVPINMTDYNVKPPVKFGVFTTKPDVKITFTCLLKQTAEK